MISQNELIELFIYSKGKLFWNKAKQSIKLGQEAGCLDDKGYICVTIKGKNYKLHRLIFLYHHGYLPKFIDHIDTNIKNNNIENLRPATKSENACNRTKQKNNTSGIKGISWNKKLKKWRVQCNKDGKSFYLGVYSDINDAELTLLNFRVIIHGQYTRN